MRTRETILESGGEKGPTWGGFRLMRCCRAYSNGFNAFLCAIGNKFVIRMYITCIAELIDIKFGINTRTIIANNANIENSIGLLPCPLLELNFEQLMNDF